MVIGADYEYGAGMRQRGGYFLPNNIYLGGATVFPPQMGIGASRDTSLAYQLGRITAVEGRAIGVHIAFAPVLESLQKGGGDTSGSVAQLAFELRVMQGRLAAGTTPNTTSTTL